MSVNLIVFIHHGFFFCFVFFNPAIQSFISFLFVCFARHSVSHIFATSLHTSCFSSTCFLSITPSLADTSPFLASPESSRSVSSSTSSSSSSTSSSASRAVDGREAEVRLLPPLLKDQAWGVHSQEAFLLFCLALGEWPL